jgi:hypothetical protein
MGTYTIQWTELRTAEVDEDEAKAYAKSKGCSLDYAVKSTASCLRDQDTRRITIMGDVEIIERPEKVYEKPVRFGIGSY